MPVYLAKRSVDIMHLGRGMVDNAIAATAEFIASTSAPAARATARRRSLKDAWYAVRAICDLKCINHAIYEHCLPFNVARAYDEARGIDHPRIWTAERDIAMWQALERGAPVPAAEA